MRVLTSRLQKRALDYAVAIARGKSTEDLCYLMIIYDTEHNYSSSWDKSGPLLEEAKIGLRHRSDGWEAGTSTGGSALEAMLREYVYNSLGSYVDIPEEILDLNRA